MQIIQTFRQVLGMGDIENFVYDYCEARISRLSRLLFFTVLLLKIDYKHVKLFLNVCKNPKTCYDK